jgi:coatomer protein complex subunit epsilon
MSEPDELYTLRAQFWLGHYQMALEEGKSIMRRPMSPQLKQEREEYVARCYIAMKDYGKVIAGGGDEPGKYLLLATTPYKTITTNQYQQIKIGNSSLWSVLSFSHHIVS